MLKNTFGVTRELVTFVIYSLTLRYLTPCYLVCLLKPGSIGPAVDASLGVYAYTANPMPTHSSCQLQTQPGLSAGSRHFGSAQNVQVP